jgi:hypothetical protein
MSVCKHKKIVLIGGGDPDYSTGESLRKIVCGQCGCSMTRKDDPNSYEYIYVEASNNGME